MFPERTEAWVRHADFRDDAEVSAALGTPSGFIETFSRKIERYGYADCKGHPVGWRSTESARTAAPAPTASCQGCSPVHRTSACTRSCANPSRCTQTYAIAGREPIVPSAPGRRRGIQHTATWCAFFNDRGQLLAGAHVRTTSRGVGFLHPGRRLVRADRAEIGALDTYGDPNTLTLDIGTAPAAARKATSANTCLVQIEKFRRHPAMVTSFGARSRSIRKGGR